ncbi:DMT family transporter [Histidinibacterium aquaticum]|uniref:DMT family transporter n=1 Tax=Histidinibacterium aquaticum TaxID=2613962 RepID=A0A5J5GD34_9RHOB|nr:DMT family transporter [Histidinibacterium aquaticum]KAA9006106.1 DMT family transporter [Histidinibacterium aquaticum]
MHGNLKGALTALLAFGIFATHDVLVKVLGGTYSPVQLVFFSVLLSFPLMTVMLVADAKPGTLQPVHPWWVALRTGAAVMTGLSAFYAFSVLPLAQVYSILFASPLIITVLAIPVLGERVRLRRWAAVIVGLIGVVVVLRPGSTALSLGHLAALLAAFGSATASIVVRRIGADERPVVLLLYPMVANVVLMGAALYWVYEPMPVEHLGLLFLLSMMGWTAGWLIVSAYNAGEAAIVAPMQYSQILWASAYGLIFFDESIDLWTGIGAGIIITSGLYIVLRESRTGASGTRPVLRTRSRPETSTSFRIGPVLRLRGKHPDAD